mmetsp:Transcript_33974/g.53023  ORF Transcript_33974/g.53023 Transcript_33974/m.53023 type:complete len:257 (-) Transcript_33974:1016-1786(-)
MTPPQLTTDTPIADVVEPIEPRLFVLFRNDLQFLISDGIGGSLGHGIAVDVPLGGDHGFENVSRSRAKTETHLVGFFSFEQALFIQSLFHRNTSVISHHSLEFISTMMINRSIRRQYGNKFQIMTLSTFVIVRIVRRGNLDGSRTKTHIDQLGVGHDRNASSRKGMNHEFPVQMRVPRIFWMDGHGGISQHGFQTCRGDDQLFVTVFHRIRKTRQDAKFVPSLGILRIALGMSLDFQKRSSFQFDVIHFDIRNGRL